MKRRFFSFFLLIISETIFPQVTNWIIYDNNSITFPTNYILSAESDTNGTVWLGTAEGLVNFGDDFIANFNNQNSHLPNNYITHIKRVADGTLWISTANGVALYNGQDFIIYNTQNSGLPNNSILYIEEDANGDKWIGTDGGGLVKFDGTNWTVYNSSNSPLPSNKIFSISIENNNKWIGTYNGLVKYDDYNWVIYNKNNSGLPNNLVRSIDIDDEGNKWIGTYGGGVAKFYDTTWVIFNKSNSGLTDDYVTSVLVDFNGIKWIGTAGFGLVKFDGVQWTTFYTTDFVNSIKEDTYNNIWIATKSGVIKYDRINWSYYNNLNYNIFNLSQIRVIEIDADENKWFGSYNTGLAKFDGIKWRIYNTSNSGLPNNIINAITTQGNGIKWIGTNDGLVKFENSSWTLYNTSNSELPDNVITSLSDGGNGMLWVGTQTGGLVRYDGINWQIFNTQNSGIPSNNITTLGIENRFIKWVGTSDQGIARFNDTTWTIFNTTNSVLPGNEISSIAIDKQGNKWIGVPPTWNYPGYTGGGLAKYDGFNWSIYDTSNSNIPGNRVYCIKVDSNNNIWIGMIQDDPCLSIINCLAKFDGQNWYEYPPPLNPTWQYGFLAMAIDSVGNKWVGFAMNNIGVGLFNESGVVNVEEITSKNIPKKFILHQNFPNPFNSSTKIRYEVDYAVDIRLVVCDVLGRIVTTLVNESKNPGNYYVNFNTRDLASGIYFYSLQAGNYFEIKKMVLIK